MANSIDAAPIEGAGPSSLKDDLACLLQWYADVGVDEAVSDTPFIAFGPEPTSNLADFTPAGAPEPSRLAAASIPKERARAPKEKPLSQIVGTDVMSADEAVQLARHLAAKATTVEELRSAVEGFDGCQLKKGARQTVFADGAIHGDLLVIGEAPGRDEDKVGRPFVGRAGQLLDKMLGAIGRNRETDTLITNVVYWRPPGNRTPTNIEVAVCRPFVDRLIDLVEPKAIMLAGGAPTQALLDLSGIMRERGQWRTLTTASGRQVPALPMFHPAFLLRQPAQKRLAWRDMQALAEKLRDA